MQFQSNNYEYTGCTDESLQIVPKSVIICSHMNRSNIFDTSGHLKFGENSTNLFKDQVGRRFLDNCLSGETQ